MAQNVPVRKPCNEYCGAMSQKIVPMTDGTRPARRIRYIERDDNMVVPGPRAHESRAVESTGEQR